MTVTAMNCIVLYFRTIKRDHLVHTGAHRITLSWSEFMGGYNTADKS